MRLSTCFFVALVAMSAVPDNYPRNSRGRAQIHQCGRSPRLNTIVSLRRRNRCAMRPRGAEGGSANEASIGRSRTPLAKPCGVRGFAIRS